MKTKIQFAEISDTGGRQENQDYSGHFLTDTGALFVVADGMGGHKGGALASRYFTEALLDHAKRALKGLAKKPEMTLAEIVLKAGREMRQQVHLAASGQDPRTTCAIAWLDDSGVVSAHLGDTRVYGLTKDKVLWQTRDHSIVQLLLEQGEVSDDEVARHPDQNRLYKSIGGDKDPDPTIKRHPTLAPGQGLLLCSDGFWEYVETPEMCALVTANDINTALRTLVSLAVRRAGNDSDNVTAQLVLVQ